MWLFLVIQLLWNGILSATTKGNVDGFDGVTIAEFDADIKICDLKEFQSKVEHYCPYDS